MVMEKWVRVLAKNGGQVLHDRCYLCAREDYDELHNDVLSLRGAYPYAKIEIHEFWVPARETQCFDSGNIFARD